MPFTVSHNLKKWKWYSQKKNHRCIDVENVELRACYLVRSVCVSVPEQPAQPLFHNHLRWPDFTENPNACPLRPWWWWAGDEQSCNDYGRYVVISHDTLDLAKFFESQLFYSLPPFSLLRMQPSRLSIGQVNHKMPTSPSQTFNIQWHSRSDSSFELRGEYLCHVPWGVSAFLVGYRPGSEVKRGDMQVQ